MKSGTRDLQRHAPTSTSAHSALDARNSLLPDDNPEPRCASTSSAARSAGRSAGWPSFYFVNVEGDRRAARPRRGWRTCRRRPSAPATSARRGVDAGRSVHAAAVRRQRDPGRRGSTPRGRRDSPALYPAPNRADADANFVSSPEGRARRDPVRRSRPTITAGATSRSTCATPSAATIAICRSRRTARNLPGFGVSVLDQGHNCRRRLSRSARAALFNEMRVRLQRAATARTCRRAPGADGFAALGITAPPLDRHRSGLSDRRRARLRDASATTPTCRCARQTRTIHLSDSSGHRSRPPPRQARRRAAALSARTASTTCSRAARRSSPAPSPDIRSATCCSACRPITLLAANDNRQALRTWSANVLRAGRLAHLAAADASTPASATSTTRRRSTPTIAWSIFDPATPTLLQVGQDGVSRSGLDGDFNNFAPRVGVSWDLTGRGTLRAARRLRHLLRQRHADRELGALLQPAVLSRCSCSSRARPRRSSATIRSRPAAASPPTPTVNTLDPALPHGYAQQASLGLERAFTGADARRRATSARSATATCASATSTSRRRGPARSIRPPADSRATATSCSSSRRRRSRYHALQLSGRCGRSRRGLSFRAGYTLVDVEGRHVGVPRHRRRRQHAAEQPRFRRRVGAVRLRRAASAGRVGDLGRAGPRRRAGCFRALAGQRRLHRAVGAAVHAARQLRQQQHRQHRRRHVRLRPPERRRRHAAARAR